MNKIIQFTLALIISISFASCSKKEKSSSNTEESIPVTVTSPLDLNATSTVSASGTIEASQSATLSTRVMGHVEKINVVVGQKVKKGQILLNINNSDLEAKKAQANANLIQAKSNFIIAEKDYNRYKNLLEKKSASQKEFDDISTRYEMAKAQVEGAQQMTNEIGAILNYSSLKAPFNGVVTGKMINEGDMANPGVPLLTIETPNHFIAKVMVPESDISLVKLNDKVKVLIKSNGKILDGYISEKSASSKGTGGLFFVKIELNSQKDIDLYSGMYVIANFPVKRESNTVSNSLLIPQTALIKKGELTGIYTISQSNTAILRWVRIGNVVGENIEVLSGLSNDEKIIMKSDGKLYNGVPVEIK